MSHWQGLEAVPRRIEDRVQKRWNDGKHPYFGGALGRLVAQRRQHFDLERSQRQVRSPRDDILAEVPLPIAGAVLIKRERLEEGITD